MEATEPFLAAYRGEEWYAKSRKVLQTLRYGRWPDPSKAVGIRTEGWVVAADLAAAYGYDVDDLVYALKEHSKKIDKAEERFELQDLDGDGVVWRRDPVYRAGEVERGRRRRDGGGGGGDGGGDGRHGRECWGWKRHGVCKWGDECKFAHVRDRGR